MRFTFNEIKKEISDNFDEISEAPYIEDALDQWADGFVPVYNNEIIQEWQEMPSEFDDSWKDYGFAPDDGIIRLMMIDLYRYYLDQTTRAYNEIKAEKEEAEND